MKTMRILVVLGLLSFMAIPQADAATGAYDLKAGTIMIAGDSNFNLGFNSVKLGEGDKVKTTNFNLDVTGGYFVIDNLEVIVNFGFDYSKAKDGVETTDTNFILAGGANYYFDMKSALFPYAGGFLGFNRIHTESSDSYYNYDDTSTGFIFGVQGGAKYFLNKHFAADAGLRLTIGSGDIDMTEFSLFAGVAVVL